MIALSSRPLLDQIILSNTMRRSTRSFPSFRKLPIIPQAFFLKTNTSALAAKCRQRVHVIKACICSSWNRWSSSSSSSCMYFLANCAEDESQSCSLEYQGFCLEPKWLRPSWGSAAPLRPLACVHPNGGVGGSCGSGYSFRTQQKSGILQHQWYELETCA